MSTHPHDALADYVDGTLDTDVRATVETHLTSCATCAAEVQRATTARAALRDLPDLDPPAGLLADTLDSLPAVPPPSDDLVARRRKRTARFTALAAAAAVVLVFVIALPSFMGARSRLSSTEVARPAAAGAPAAQTQGAVDLQDLALAERDRYADDEGITIVRPDEDGNAAPLDDGQDSEEADMNAQADASPAAPPPGFASETAGDNFDAEGGGTARRAVEAAKRLGLREVSSSGTPTRCLRSSGAFSQGGQLLRVLEGDETGAPSYFGVLLEGPATGGTPDRVVIWVADQGTCQAVGFAQAYIVYPTLSSPPPGFEFP